MTQDEFSASERAWRMQAGVGLGQLLAQHESSYGSAKDATPQEVKRIEVGQWARRREARFGLVNLVLTVSDSGALLGLQVINSGLLRPDEVRAMLAFLSETTDGKTTPPP